MGSRESVRRWLLDAWPCLPFVALGLIGTEAAATFQPDAARPVDALAYMLALAAALALALRRYPGLCLTLNGAAVTTYLAAGYPYGPVLLTVPAAVFLVAVRWPWGRAGLVIAANLGVLIVASGVKRMREPGGVDTAQMWSQTLTWGVICAATLMVGATIRIRREAMAGVRTEQARRVATEERLRMAQDLHDSIGHGLAAIAMQAGVALHVLDRDPYEARSAMEAVRATSRESLENLRAALETLRRPGAAQRHPTPGLEDLGGLTDRVRAGGVAVQVDIDPGLPPLPSIVDAAAYRILQESLTNVLRHADAAATQIRVRCENGMLLLDVTNTGRDGALDSAPVGTSATAGSGIRGMRAQAEALGGTLHAGPQPVGGFAVAARLPLRGGEVR